jgi:purine-binding chemotaxis protein CheW
MNGAAIRASGQCATFFVGGRYLGVDVLEVQEVLREQRLTCVPLAPDVIEGLLNLRGEIVPALDMRRLLDLPPREEGSSPLSVVVRTGHGAVSLQVDEIGDVVEVDPAAFEEPPRNMDSKLRSMLRGVQKLKDRLLLVLDIPRTVDVEGA